MGYFPNLILLSAFLGLGVGALQARAKSLMWLWPVGLLLLVGSAWAMGHVAFTAKGVTEHLWLLYVDLPEGARVVEGIRLPLVALFSISALTFVPLGQYVGVRLEGFRKDSSALWGYSLDLAGSLVGVVCFTAISFSGLRPVWWFLPTLLGGLFLVSGRPRLRIFFVVAGAALFLVVGRMTGPELYSPYYAVEDVPVENSPDHEILANGSLHQIAIDFSGQYLGFEDRQRTLVGYRLPYERLGRPIRKALVLGAGTGNDVAVLLAQGAQEVHAVEIDPVILDLGREVHPNLPYADARITVHQVDARSFLNETTDRFDLIVFGTLDSMTRLSALSNVRLDNFVYTQEALAAARDRLTPDGGMVMFFSVADDYIFEHLTGLLATTFGRLPVVHRAFYNMFNVIFMAGPAYEDAALPVEQDAWYLQEGAAIGLPSDDWPYLYLPSAGVDSFYLSMIGLLALVSVLAIFGASRGMRSGLLRENGIDVEMFLYGFAFLLMETKFVTAMNLLWGATWLTSAVVFGSILVTILAGTVLMEVRPVAWKAAGAGLVGALMITYVIPLDALLRTDPSTRLALSVLYVAAPVIFASLCFAARFKARPAADLAFGWNLLGAVLGGLTEFFSMALGFRAMTLVAIMAYLLAFLVANRSPTTASPAAALEAAPV